MFKLNPRGIIHCLLFEQHLGESNNIPKSIAYCFSNI